MWQLTDEQRELRDHIREFALSEVREAMLEVDETRDYPREVHDALAREGYLGLGLPAEHGARAPAGWRSAPTSRSWRRCRARRR